MSADELVSRRPRLNALFFLVLGVMVAHEAEHVAQILQKDVLDASCPNDCRGLLGFAFDLEWVHAAYNHSLLVALAILWLAYRMWRPEWRRARPAAWAALTLGVFVVQGYHVVEHSFKLEQWLENGHRSPTPGLLGMGLSPAEGRNFSLIELHFLFNTVVLVCVLAGYLGLRFHRHLLPRTARPAWAAAVATLTVLGAGSAYAWTERPPTHYLAAGVHQGPIVLDRAERLIGRPGAIVRGGIRVRARDVVVRDVTVVGGEYGIDVDGATDVVLDRVTVIGATLDAIHVRRASVTIRRCRIRSLGGQYAQGIDISFAFDLPPSRVKGCEVSGGLEGIVSHFARVALQGNRVERSRLRGIAVTEMSMGTVRRNEVRDALGVGIFCGDYSECAIEGNIVEGTRPDHASGDRSRMGYAIVAHFGAHARLSRNRLAGNHAHGAAAFIGATVEQLRDGS